MSRSLFFRAGVLDGDSLNIVIWSGGVLLVIVGEEVFIVRTGAWDRGAELRFEDQFIRMIVMTLMVMMMLLPGMRGAFPI